MLTKISILNGQHHFIHHQGPEIQLLFTALGLQGSQDLLLRVIFSDATVCQEPQSGSNWTAHLGLVLQLSRSPSKGTARQWRRWDSVKSTQALTFITPAVPSPTSSAQISPCQQTATSKPPRSKIMSAPTLQPKVSTTETNPFTFREMLNARS